MKNQVSVCSFDPNEYYKKPRRGIQSSSSENEKSPKKSVFSRIVQLCSVRDRSTCELKERLLKDGYSLEEVEAAVKRACDCALVDDYRFADAFVRGKVSAGKGPCIIEKELSKHNIQLTMLSDWPDGYGLSESLQVEHAVDYLRSNPPRSKDKYAGACRKLIQRGYSTEIAVQATRIWLNR